MQGLEKGKWRQDFHFANLFNVQDVNINPIKFNI